MADAKTLYREGVTAIREQKDLAAGRRLLTQSLRLDPNNDMAWLWLTRTTQDAAKQLQCVERALEINPANSHAQVLRQQLTTAAAGSNGHGASPAPASKTIAHELTPAEEKEIESLLFKAQNLLDHDHTEEAVEYWVRALDIQVDHPVALGNAVRHLSRLKYMDDAKELVWNALNANTSHPSVYLTAIDICKREDNQHEADNLRCRLARLPDTDEKIAADMVDYFLRSDRTPVALEILPDAIANHPRSQKLLVQMGDALNNLGRDKEALPYYERAVRLGARTEEGKTADSRLDAHAPEVTDKERGSVVMAAREAVGIGLFFLLLAWQDARLNLLWLGPGRLIGVLLGVLGGYLLVTATSSPQQRPLVKLLGGQPVTDGAQDTDLPILPVAVRAALGVAGVVLLVVAFGLVASTALQLTGTYTAPQVPTLDELLELE